MPKRNTYTIKFPEKNDSNNEKDDWDLSVTITCRGHLVIKDLGPAYWERKGEYE